MMALYVACIGLFAAAVGLHSLVCRLPLRLDTTFKFLLCGGLLGIGLAAYAMFLHPEVSLLQAIAALAVYAMLCEFYIFLFSLVVSSLSVSFLIHLRGHEQSRADFDRLMSDRDMVHGRLANLVAGGYLAKGEEGYILTPKGRVFAVAVARLRRFFFPRHATGSDGLLREE